MKRFCLLVPGAMERIGQSDVATILGRLWLKQHEITLIWFFHIVACRLHQELKSQTRDSKALLRRCAKQFLRIASIVLLSKTCIFSCQRSGNLHTSHDNN